MRSERETLGREFAAKWEYVTSLQLKVRDAIMLVDKLETELNQHKQEFPDNYTHLLREKEHFNGIANQNGWNTVDLPMELIEFDPGNIISGEEVQSIVPLDYTKFQSQFIEMMGLITTYKFE